MKISWRKAFTKSYLKWDDHWSVRAPEIHSLAELKNFLDLVHVRFCLLKPYLEVPDYPPLDPRELLPSFDTDLWEHTGIPGFSMVVLERPLNYFQEVFQYDNFHPTGLPGQELSDSALLNRNMQTMQMRLPRVMHEPLRQDFTKKNITDLANYPALLPYLLEMDRAQVMGMLPESSPKQGFYLAGVYASLPSDLDTEIKRYGLRINKFAVGDNKMYEANRHFVYQHLMELYGFPVASERRTSSALFARRLHKMGERFLIRVLGQSDRTLTTLWNDSANQLYPKVEKTALVALDPDMEGLDVLRKGGYLVDTDKNVAIIRVRYRQHTFNADNVRQERALSVESHEVIHPITGIPTTEVNILRDGGNMFLRLNDIVRGEYTGRIIYKRNEIVENTDTEEKRLKFLYAWLSKHQRRMIGYGDEFFGNISRILDRYLHAPEHYEVFEALHDLHYEVIEKFNYIQQARKVRLLEDLRDRNSKSGRLSYHAMLASVIAELHDLKFEIVSYFDPLVASIITIGESILNDRYLLANYIEKRDDALTPRGMEIKKSYRKLVSLVDEFKAIRKTRTEMLSRYAQSAD
ncbi:conserved hypothetical protein [uncultured delta proteobacterium]|uniref:Uncharacterized protein n=1 Tax=uncultured delta proteobacterium TaxID=34034 RepID=A0A212J5D0_9DELT|nr:conserved hypothetical protein [uncultured delta proteobacterium]